MDYSYSEGFFSEEEGDLYSDSVSRLKMAHICDFLKKLIRLPFCICSKSLRTSGRLLRVLSTLLSILITLGINEDVRISFNKKVTVLAKDLADWVLYPFAIIVGLTKSFLKIIFYWKNDL